MFLPLPPYMYCVPKPPTNTVSFAVVEHEEQGQRRRKQRKARLSAGSNAEFYLAPTIKSAATFPGI